MIKKILLTLCLFSNITAISASTFINVDLNNNSSVSADNVVKANNNLLSLTISFLDIEPVSNTGPSIFNTSVGIFTVEATDYEVVSVANDQGGQSINIVNGNIVIQADAVVGRSRYRGEKSRHADKIKCHLISFYSPKEGNMQAH